MAKTRKAPQLSQMERERRAQQATKTLLPAAIKATGKKGFRATKEALERHQDDITNPALLAGFLKGQAKKKGLLSPAHPYVGRKKKSKK